MLVKPLGADFSESAPHLMKELVYIFHCSHDTWPQ